MDQPSFSSEKNVISTDNFLTVYFDRCPFLFQMWSAKAVCLLYFSWFEIAKMSLRVLILCVCVQAGSMMSLPWSLPKRERRHRSCKICAVDKSFIQLQFHETNTLIVQLFGQLTKGFFYNMKILTLSCFRRHKDLKLLLNLLAETSGVPQFFCNCICWPKRSWWYIRGDSNA